MSTRDFAYFDPTVIDELGNGAMVLRPQRFDENTHEAIANRKQETRPMSTTQQRQQRIYELTAFLGELEGTQEKTLALSARTTGATLGVALTAEEESLVLGHGISPVHGLRAKVKSEINKLRQGL